MIKIIGDRGLAFYTVTESALLRLNPYLLLAILALLSCAIFYLPFWLNGNIDTVFRYWDGPNYAYLAKALYSVPVDHPLSPYTKPEYFAAHLPLYPVSIWLLTFLGPGYNVAMLLSTMLFTVAATLVFFRLLVETRLVRSPLWSAFLSLFIPARYLIYHSVGATEAPFIFLTLSSLLCYIRGQYLWAFLLGGLSGITRITGVLIGAAYFIDSLIEKKWDRFWLLSLVGLPLFLVFAFYFFHYNDFFAYFGVNLSVKNSLIHSTPFKLFSIYSDRGEVQSAELYLAMYALYGAGICMLWNRSRILFLYGIVSYGFSIFIFHQDLSRYLIPLAPVALVIGYDSILSNRVVKLAAIPFICLCYIYAWGSVQHNLIVDWVYKDLIEELESK
ncbi:hypothetical protein [Teredinibacter haidensis]|uniref:hypothetical protein n=1 Tax=Teredinibacter haidensis TaxID=2731755 RepID=UPI000948B807|nr:hypothetical protein [Teredinibacter haidensis]